VCAVQTRDIFIRFITADGFSYRPVDLNLDLPLGPRVPVTSPEVLRRLLAYLGAKDEALCEYDRLPPEPWQGQRAHHAGTRPQEPAAPERFVACSRQDLQEKDPTARVRARLWGRKEGKRLLFLMSSFCPFEAFNTIPLGLQGSSRQGHQPLVPSSGGGMICMEPDKEERGERSAHPTFVGLVLRYTKLCFPYG
jgi:hypothetical protein